MFLFFFSSYSVHAQAQDAYIIVHALNPEGIEIASVEGVNRNSVEIYDGNNFLGYSSMPQLGQYTDKVNRWHKSNQILRWTAAWFWKLNRGYAKFADTGI